MFELLRKSESGEDIFGYDIKCSVKIIDDFHIRLEGSSEDLDRDNEVLAIDGWDLKNFKKNPVVLLFHNYKDFPAGRAKVDIKNNKLIFDVEFLREGLYRPVDIARELYKTGFMKGCSVGFIGKNWVEETDKKGNRYLKSLKHELLELSLCPIGCNPNSLIMEKSLKGIVTQEDMDLFLPLQDKVVTKDIPKEKEYLTKEEVTQEIERFMKEYEPQVVAKALEQFEERLEEIVNDKAYSGLYDSLLFGNPGDKASKDALEKAEKEKNLKELRDALILK